MNLSQTYGLWGMGSSPDFPANQVGGAQNPWVIADYGLSQLWVRSALAVYKIMLMCLSVLVNMQIVVSLGQVAFL
jgi:hypothetical protein